MAALEMPGEPGSDVREEGQFDAKWPFAEFASASSIAMHGTWRP